MTDSLEKRTNDFIERLKGIGYTYVSDFKNYKTKCNIKCPKGHIFSIMPRHLWEGQRCSTCRKLKEKYEKFNRFLKYIKENAEGYTYVSGFVNYKTKCTVRCPLGHEYKVIPSNFTWGKRCAKCAGNKRIYEPEFKQWRKDNLTDLEYVGGYTKIAAPCTFKCLKCGRIINTLTPNDVKGRGSRCYHCAIKARQLKQTLPVDNLIAWLEENNNKIKYISGYVNTRIPCKFQCLDCGRVWKTSPATIKGGHGCIDCVMTKIHKDQTTPLEEFIKRLKDINKNIEYVSGYVNTHTKCTMKCLVCENVWNTTTPNSLLSGSGCPKCAYVSTGEKNTKPLSYLLEYIAKNAKDYQYISGYTKATDKVKFRHNTCGTTFITKPTMFIQGQRCPKCNYSYGESYIAKYLTANHISYKGQKKFADLYDTDITKPLSYDFYVPSYNLLIEYQGEQHYKPVKFYGGLNRFAKQNLHDDMKRDYAKSHGYNLLEMPYMANTQEKVDEYLADYLARLEEKVGGI